MYRLLPRSALDTTDKLKHRYAMIFSYSHRCAVLAALLGASFGLVSLRAQSDDFNDNFRGPLWNTIEDDATLQVVEQNQRLEIISSGPTSAATDALYISVDTFRLSTASDFTVTVSWAFPSVTTVGGVGTGISLVFGLGRDLPDGTDSVAFGFGYRNVGAPFGNLGAAGGAYRIDDVQTTFLLPWNGITSGTLEMNYVAADDDLFLVLNGLTPYLLDDIVRGVWGAESVYVALGARGNGAVLTSGDAFFDDFAVVSGVIVPEPAATLPLAALLIAALVRRRSSR